MPRSASSPERLAGEERVSLHVKGPSVGLAAGADKGVNGVTDLYVDEPYAL